MVSLLGLISTSAGGAATWGVGVGWDVSPAAGAAVGSTAGTEVESGAVAVPQATTNIKMIPSSIIFAIMFTPDIQNSCVPDQTIMEGCIFEARLELGC
jgi:hypothetical protein